MPNKPGRGGQRQGSGRPPKSDQPRIQKSVNLTPRVWAFIAFNQLQFGGSESDALDRIVRGHILFVPESPDRD